MVRSLRSGRISHQSSGREEGDGEGSAHPSAKRLRRGSNNRRAQQNSTSTLSNNSQRQSVPCAKCDKSLPSDADHIKIHPCKHALCTVCAYRSQIDRGSKPHRCPVPSCNCYSTKSEYCYGHPTINNSSNNNEMIDNVIVGDDEYVKNNLPLEYLKQRHANEIREDKHHEAIVLHCSKAKLDDEGYLVVQSVTSTLVIKKTTNDDVDILNINQALVEVQNFFGFLHYPIVCTSNTDEIHPPVLSPRELLEMRCQRRRILDGALYALSTGIIDFDTTRFLSPNSSDHQKHFMAATITADILLRNLNTKPGYFQLMFGELLVRQQITKEFKDLCSILNLAPSRKYILKSRAKDVLKQLNDGLKLNPRDFVILLFDNIGFKILGRQASYDQWIVINIVIVTEDELRAVGFYRDDDESDAAIISREQSVDWAEEVSNVSTELEMNALADTIIGINDSDFDRLSVSVLEGIKFAIDNKVRLSPNNGTNQQSSPIPLPRFERIINEETRVEMDALKDGKQPAAQQQRVQQSQSHSVALPRDYLPNDVTNELVTGNVTRRINGAGEVVAEDAEEGDGYITKLNLQVLHDDLSQKDTVDDLLMYALQSNGKQMGEWAAYREEQQLPDNAESPVSEVMVALGTDGQPAAQARRLLEEDATYPTPMFVSFGGFHTVMKTLNANGEYFEEMLKYFFGVFRDTLDKVKWILTPSDPRQREEEYPWYLLAMYSRAHQNLEEHLERSVSAAEVHQFMLERAEAYPICALVLLELRMGEVAKLMRNSERIGQRGSVSLFMTAVKFALPLFALTHKSDYVFLCQDLLKYYHCASPAQRKLYESFIFTQTTKHGKPIFHDAFVEVRCVMGLRGELGKVSRKGMEVAMEAAAASIPGNEGRDTSSTNLRGTTQVHSASKSCTWLSSTNPACPFFKVAAAIDEMQLFTPDKPPILKKKRGGTIECNDTILEVPGGGSLHASILSAITGVGRDRSRRHFVAYDIKEQKKRRGRGEPVTRSDKIVNLKKINTTVDSIKESLDKDIILETSTTVSDFGRQTFTISLLTQQIKKMQEREAGREEGERITIPDVANGARKDQVVDQLVKSRAAVFAKHTTLKEELTSSIKEKYISEGASTRESRRELLEDRLFKLSDSVVTRERYTTRAE